MSRRRVDLVRTRALGVVLPVHNEEAHLEMALAAIGDALDFVDAKLQLGVVVVLDACDDASAHLVRRWQREIESREDGVEVHRIECPARNVGVARALGCADLLTTWSDIDAAQIWLATTDTDSRVPREWLLAQLHEHEGHRSLDGARAGRRLDGV